MLLSPQLFGEEWVVGGCLLVADQVVRLGELDGRVRAQLGGRGLGRLPRAQLHFFDARAAAQLAPAARAFGRSHTVALLLGHVRPEAHQQFAGALSRLPARRGRGRLQ